MPDANKANLKSVGDIRRFEVSPIAARISEQSVYELMCNAADAWGDGLLFTYKAKLMMPRPT